MAMPEILLMLAGVVCVTLGVIRIAACRAARHTSQLLRHGWRDWWL